MATYEEFEAFVQKNYKVFLHADTPKNFMRFTFPMPPNGDRTQLLLVGPGSSKKLNNVIVLSPVGVLKGPKLIEALQTTLDSIAGGLVMIGDMVYVKSSILLDNVDANEIDAPFAVTAMTADDLEKKFVGGDEH